MQKKNAQSNGVVMRRGALPDKLASMKYYDNEWVKYSLIVPQESLRTNPDGSPKLSRCGGLMVEVPVKNRQHDKLLFPPEKHLKEFELDGFVRLQGFMKYGSVNHQTFMAIDANKLQKRCNAKQHSIEVQELYSNSQPTYSEPVLGMDGSVSRMQTSHTQKVAQRPEVAAFEKEASDKAEIEVKGAAKGYRQYQAVKDVVLQKESADLLETSKVMLLNGYINDYNTCLDFAQTHNCDIQFEPPVDVDNITDYEKAGADMHFAVNDAYSKLEKECRSRGDIDMSMLPLIGDYSNLKKSAGSKTLSPAEVTDLYNRDRNISVYDVTGHVICRDNNGFKYPASFNRYALSEREMRKLEENEKNQIVLSEVATSDNKGCKNYIIQLKKLDKPDKNGMTHTLVPVGECDITSEIFRNPDLNGKYFDERKRFDTLQSAIETHNKVYNEKIEERVEKLGQKIKDAQTVSHKRHNLAKDTRHYTGTANYTVSEFYDFARKRDTFIEKRRSEALLNETRERLIQQDASPSGVKKGFTNMYEEIYFKQHDRQQKNTLARIESALAYGRDNPQSSMDMKKLESLHETFMTYAEYSNKELQMRQQPVTDSKYLDMGFANQWDVYVFETYHEQQKNDDRSLAASVMAENYVHLTDTMMSRGRALPTVADSMDMESDADYELD